MEKYSIVIPKCGCHILADSFLRSVKKHLDPMEVILIDSVFKYSKRSKHHGQCMNEGINQSKTNLVLLSDHDILVLDSECVNKMIETMQKENVFACGYFDYPFDGIPLLTPFFTMINKEMFLKNGIEFDGSGNPAYNTFFHAKSLDQKIIKLDSKNSIFHLGQGALRTYDDLMIKDELRTEFENWKMSVASKANFNDYVVDDGMDYIDNDWLNWQVLSKLDECINKKEPFSTIRLGDLGLRYLYDYFFDSKDFTHVGIKHPDLAMPNDKIGKELIRELIENMKEADWVDHPDLYKGAFGDRYRWRWVLGSVNKIYKKAEIKRPFCSSLQGYLTFVEDFEITLYDILKNRRIMYVGPFDEISLLNERKDLRISKYKYYNLSLDSDPMIRYNVMNDFMKTYDPDDWDLVLVTGSLYGRTIIGRIKRAGGRAFDLGQAINFHLSNVFENVLKPNEEKTYYKIIDHYKKEKSYASNS